MTTTFNQAHPRGRKSFCDIGWTKASPERNLRTRIRDKRAFKCETSISSVCCLIDSPLLCGFRSCLFSLRCYARDSDPPGIMSQNSVSVLVLQCIINLKIFKHNSHGGGNNVFLQVQTLRCNLFLCDGFKKESFLLLMPSWLVDFRRTASGIWLNCFSGRISSKAKTQPRELR